MTISFKNRRQLISTRFAHSKGAFCNTAILSQYRGSVGYHHMLYGLVNYSVQTPKCCHLRMLTRKGTLRQVFIRVYRPEIQSVSHVAFYLRTFAPLTFSLVQLSSLSLRQINTERTNIETLGSTVHIIQVSGTQIPPDIDVFFPRPQIPGG